MSLRRILTTAAITAAALALVSRVPSLRRLILKRRIAPTIPLGEETITLEGF